MVLEQMVFPSISTRTNGQVLTSDGTDISWEDASGGGSSAADDITTGDAAVNITTGNVTVNALMVN